MGGAVHANCVCMCVGMCVGPVVRVGPVKT